MSAIRWRRTGAGRSEFTGRTIQRCASCVPGRVCTLRLVGAAQIVFTARRYAPATEYVFVSAVVVPFLQKAAAIGASTVANTLQYTQKKKQGRTADV